MNVSQLSGDLLDYWVAKALGGDPIIKYGACWFYKNEADPMLSHPFSPSTVWSQGGPFIEQEIILTGSHQLMNDSYEWQHIEWKARKAGDDEERTKQYGPTLLIAAMRCYVASKYGESVPDEQ